MTSRTAVLEPLAESQPLPTGAPPEWEGLPPGPPRVETLPPPVSNAALAMLALIVFEAMLFAGLLGGHIVFKQAAPRWPPAGQPRLPLAMTWLNTAILLASCAPMALARKALRRGHRRSFVRALWIAAALGGVFLAIQGSEWLRLLAHGLRIEGAIYGGMFLLLIGLHGLHVLAAVLWLISLAVLAAAGRIGPARKTAFETAFMYWIFVCAVWLVVFPLVYLP